MKRFLFVAARILGLPHVFRFFHRDELTIVLYHGVAPREHEGRRGIYNYRGKFIPPEVFEQQLRYLQKHYRILELDDAIRGMRKGTLPRRSLAVTFDDGYRNFYDHAFPILQELGVPATIFLTTDFVFKKKPLWVDRLEYAIGRREGEYAQKIALDARLREELKRLPDVEKEKRLQKIERSSGTTFFNFEMDRGAYAPLTEGEVRELREAGISIGAHTMTHPILSRISKKRAREEIQGSLDALLTVCATISASFAYPNGQRGDWNKDTERIVKECGFGSALTTIEGFNDRNTHPYQLRRIAMDATDEETFAATASGMRLFLRKITPAALLRNK